MNYTREDLITDLRGRLKVSEPLAKELVNELFGCVTTALKDGKRVIFKGFASYDVRTRKAKIGRNPKKPGSPPIPIPARKVVRFKSSKELDHLLNS